MLDVACAGHDGGFFSNRREERKARRERSCSRGYRRHLALIAAMFILSQGKLQGRELEVAEFGAADD